MKYAVLYVTIIAMRGDVSMSENNEIDEILKEIRGKSTHEPEKEKPSEVPFNFSENNNDKENHNNFDIITDSFKQKDTGAEKSSIPEYDEIETGEVSDKPQNKKIKPIIIIIIAVLVIAIIGTSAYFIWAKNKKPEPETTTEPTTVSTTVKEEKIVNPLTGTADYNKSAIGKRPVACVVENASAARPQWGIDSEKNAPDIIVEGEVEGGESRMLWIYADYTSLPEQIGPMRSARPPFIRFSQLFDSIFIHWGQSTSKGNYVGADSVFQSENVDHINQMSYNDKFNLFGRDKSRNVSSEHTGVLYGAKLEEAIKDTGFRTDVNDSSFSTFSFNEKDAKVSETACNAIGVRFSSSSKVRDWTYSADDKMYHSTDYQTDVSRKNILVLFDTTSYIVKYDYKGSGNSETYCDYSLAGGSGKLASMGTVTDITWTVDGGKLKITDTNGKEISLNAGTTWIGWASSNNGGTAEAPQAQ